MLTTQIIASPAVAATSLSSNNNTMNVIHADDTESYEHHQFPLGTDSGVALNTIESQIIDSSDSSFRHKRHMVSEMGRRDSSTSESSLEHLDLGRTPKRLNKATSTPLMNNRVHSPVNLQKQRLPECSEEINHDENDGKSESSKELNQSKGTEKEEEEDLKKENKQNQYKEESERSYSDHNNIREKEFSNSYSQNIAEKNNTKVKDSRVDVIESEVQSLNSSHNRHLQSDSNNDNIFKGNRNNEISNNNYNNEQQEEVKEESKQQYNHLKRQYYGNGSRHLLDTKRTSVHLEYNADNPNSLRKKFRFSRTAIESASISHESGFIDASANSNTSVNNSGLLHLMNNSVNNSMTDTTTSVTTTATTTTSTTTTTTLNVNKNMTVNSKTASTSSLDSTPSSTTLSTVALLPPTSETVSRNHHSRQNGVASTECTTGDTSSSPESGIGTERDDMKYVCPICEVVSATPHEFTTHIRCHNYASGDTENFTCRICSKVLSSASSLDRHVLVHTGERPFNCKYCHLTFTTNGNMHRHMRTHKQHQHSQHHQRRSSAANKHHHHHNHNNSNSSKNRNNSNNNNNSNNTSNGNINHSNHGDSKKSANLNNTTTGESLKLLLKNNNNNNNNNIIINSNKTSNTSFLLTTNGSNRNTNGSARLGLESYESDGGCSTDTSTANSQSSLHNISNKYNNNNNNNDISIDDRNLKTAVSRLNEISPINLKFDRERTHHDLQQHKQHENSNNIGKKLEYPEKLGVHEAEENHLKCLMNSNNNEKDINYLRHRQYNQTLLQQQQQQQQHFNSENNYRDNAITNNYKSYHLQNIKEDIHQDQQANDGEKCSFYQRLNLFNNNGSILMPNYTTIINRIPPINISVANGQDAIIPTIVTTMATTSSTQQLLSSPSSALILNCPICEATNFQDLQTLDQHLDEKHSNIPAKCKHCKVIFRTHYQLNVHPCSALSGALSDRVTLLMEDNSQLKLNEKNINNLNRYHRNSDEDDEDIINNAKNNGSNDKNNNQEGVIGVEKEPETEDSKLADIRSQEFLRQLYQKSSHLTLDQQQQLPNDLKISNTEDDDDIKSDPQDSKDLADIQTILNMTSPTNTSNFLKNFEQSVNTPSSQCSYDRDEEEAQDVFTSEFRKMKLRGEFPCKLCPAVYPNLRALKGHNRIHIADVGINGPFRCNMCTYVTCDKVTLIRHMRTHNGDRPYECAVCNYAFTTKANCERHLRNRHAKSSRDDVKRAIIYHPSEDSSLEDNISNCGGGGKKTGNLYSSSEYDDDLAMELSIPVTAVTPSSKDCSTPVSHLKEMLTSGHSPNEKPIKIQVKSLEQLLDKPATTTTTIDASDEVTYSELHQEPEDLTARDDATEHHCQSFDQSESNRTNGHAVDMSMNDVLDLSNKKRSNAMISTLEDDYEQFKPKREMLTKNGRQDSKSETNKDCSLKEQGEKFEQMTVNEKKSLEASMQQQFQQQQQMFFTQQQHLQHQTPDAAQYLQQFYRNLIFPQLNPFFFSNPLLANNGLTDYQKFAPLLGRMFGVAAGLPTPPNLSPLTPMAAAAAAVMNGLDVTDTTNMNLANTIGGGMVGVNNNNMNMTAANIPQISPMLSDKSSSGSVNSMTSAKDLLLSPTSNSAAMNSSLLVSAQPPAVTANASNISSNSNNNTNNSNSNNNNAPTYLSNGPVKMILKNGVFMPKQKQRRYRTERPFACEHCSARFTLRSNMERHIKQQHPQFYAQRQRSCINNGGQHGSSITQLSSMRAGRNGSNSSNSLHHMQNLQTAFAHAYHVTANGGQQLNNGPSSAPILTVATTNSISQNNVNSPISEQVKYAILAQQLKSRQDTTDFLQQALAHGSSLVNNNVLANSLTNGNYTGGVGEQQHYTLSSSSSLAFNFPTALAAKNHKGTDVTPHQEDDEPKLIIDEDEEMDHNGDDGDGHEVDDEEDDDEDVDGEINESDNIGGEVNDQQTEYQQQNGKAHHVYDNSGNNTRTKTKGKHDSINKTLSKNSVKSLNDNESNEQEGRVSKQKEKKEKFTVNGGGESILEQVIKSGKKNDSNGKGQSPSEKVATTPKNRMDSMIAQAPAVGKFLKDVASSPFKDESQDLVTVAKLVDNATNNAVSFNSYFRPSDLTNHTEHSDEEGLVSSGSASESNNSGAEDAVVTVQPKKKSAYSLAPNRVSCPYCQRMFPWSSSLRRHILTHTGQKPFKCSHCPLLFTTKSNCDRHLLRKHGNIESATSVYVPDEDVNEPIPPPKSVEEIEKMQRQQREEDELQCKTRVKSKDRYREKEKDREIVELEKKQEKHLEKERERNYKKERKERKEDGDLMAKAFSNSTEVNTSVSALLEQKEEPIQSVVNRMDYKESEHLQRQQEQLKSFLQELENGQNYTPHHQTNQCSPISLNHLSPKLVTVTDSCLMSSSELPFKCHLCENSFLERAQCLEHIRTLHTHEFSLLLAKGTIVSETDAITLLACKDEEEQQSLLANRLNGAGEEFSNGASGSARLVSGKYPDYSNRKVICAFCMRRFWSTEDLRRHMRTHSGERPFQCEICLRKFTLKHSMLRHMKKHNGHLTGSGASFGGDGCLSVNGNNSGSDYSDDEQLGTSQAQNSQQALMAATAAAVAAASSNTSGLEGNGNLLNHLTDNIGSVLSSKIHELLVKANEWRTTAATATTTTPTIQTNSATNGLMNMLPAKNSLDGGHIESGEGANQSMAEASSDLIGNLLGISDQGILNKLMSSADEAAKLLGVNK